MVALLVVPFMNPIFRPYASALEDMVISFDVGTPSGVRTSIAAPWVQLVLVWSTLSSVIVYLL
jgi:hypothetical protein